MHNEELRGTITVNYDAEGFEVVVSGWLPSPEQWALILTELVMAYREGVRRGK